MPFRKFIIFLFVCFLTVISVYTQENNLGQFISHTDIGKVKTPGTVKYNPETQEYDITGSGTNMWFTEDEFHFVWKKLEGDFIIRAECKFVGNGVDPHRKMGVIFRSDLTSNSAYADVAVHGDGLTSLQYRRTNGAETEEIKSVITHADVIQISRIGQKITMSVAQFGDAFTENSIDSLVLGDSVYVGLFLCAHNPDVVESARFRNVRIILPAKEDFVPYKDYLGSNLEILSINTGLRKIIFRAPNSIQAPNWTPDGNDLIYNSDGLLYNFDLETHTSKVINTDFAVNNNNDHVLSFDGKMLGISNHSNEDEFKSIIYTLPINGGIPARITDLGPSYLHGWSPDGKDLIYTAERNGDYDIYKISAKGGEEIRLTDTKGLDDGSEFSPDGKYIYFNSVRSGTMQIWRMQPDGSNPEQMTNDNLNNWFPHISPDGQWIVFLSFQEDVDPSDHPFYKQVYLRKMPVNGGEPQVIAYVYGGQGTINVPSWSPDSKKVAFVSNTGM
jgi:TolB protein